MSIFSYFLHYIKFVTIIDILDVFIVSYLLYKLIKLIRESTASRLLKGLVLIILILQVSEIFHLNVVNYLFSNFIELGLILIVILFQPEIRKMIEQVGRSRLDIFSGETKVTSAEHAIGEISDACSGMSLSKTGALIIFERSDDLDEYIRNGTEINADISGELLKSIFYHNAPLHDGAVVIRDGRIAAARCVLPLSGNITLSHELGTRHRAAVGISEISDAISIVVSEETGSISVSIGGILKRHLTPDTLENILKKELNAGLDKKTGLLGFFKRQAVKDK